MSIMLATQNNCITRWQTCTGTESNLHVAEGDLSARPNETGANRADVCTLEAHLLTAVLLSLIKLRLFSSQSHCRLSRSACTPFELCALCRYTVSSLTCCAGFRV